MATKDEKNSPAAERAIEAIKLKNIEISGQKDAIKAREKIPISERESERGDTPKPKKAETYKKSSKKGKKKKGIPQTIPPSTTPPVRKAPSVPPVRETPAAPPVSKPPAIPPVSKTPPVPESPPTPPVPEPKERQYSLKNGMVGKEFYDKIDFEGDGCTIEWVNEGGCKVKDEMGLTFDEKTMEIKGTPKKDGNYDVVIRYQSPTGEINKRHYSLLINPDPRSLWKELPPEDPNDPKEHEDCKLIKAADRKIIAASKRGRSHAHAAKYRDDDFKIDHLDSGWSSIAVADGAGSADLSRVGSKIACEIAISTIRKNLETLDMVKFNQSLEEYKKSRKSEPIRLSLYNILGSAAFEARKGITEEVKKRGSMPTKGTPEDLFATTLLLAIHKKLDIGHFFAGFWVGDGGLAVYKENKWIELLGEPDSGEFGGQTRFLTTPNIVTNGEELSKRIQFSLVDDFTALFVMSDGITDPRFETDNNLNNREYWDKMWKELTDPKQVDICSPDKPEKKLLNWLDFWSPGNHDDRTIAILF
ncbi:protein phosphatase 2C domain-containing protein [bacterium]|nr:protein phosphatase 2C domain-containing protein [bacterium]